MSMDALASFRSVFSARVISDEPLARHTNFRIGGPARYYVDARTEDELVRAIGIARDAGIPWFVLGGGSNTLVADAGFDGLVIQMALRAIRVEGTRVIAGAGAMTAAVARVAGDAGLSGFEWAIGLPGTIGGGVRGNAGCFGGECKDVVASVRVFDGASGMINEFSNADCAFRYRRSAFKSHPEWVILEAHLALTPGQANEANSRMSESLATRKAKQPLERPSAGCLFTNVAVDALTSTQQVALAALAGDAWRAVVHDGQLPVGWIIERLGLKGYRVGNAQVSERHGNFVINLGSATAEDVAAVSDAVRSRAAEVLGLDLHEEVQRLGFT